MGTHDRTRAACRGWTNLGDRARVAKDDASGYQKPPKTLYTRFVR